MNHLEQVLASNRDSQVTGVGVAYQSPPPPNDIAAPTTILGAAERQAQQQTRALGEIAERLQMLRDRAFGSEPAAAEPRGDSGPVAGAVQQLAAAYRPHEHLIERIYHLINDLDRLA